MDPKIIWFVVWTGVLAAMLFYPVSKLVWVISVRRMEKKLNRKLDDGQINGQLQRARFVSFFLCIIFAALFNYNVFGIGGPK